MDRIEKNELGIISRIINIINSTEGFDEMRLSFLNLLRVLVPYERSNFVMASEKEAHSFDRPVSINGGDLESIQTYMDLFWDDDYSRWIFMSNQSMAYRETDLLSEETRINTTFFKNVYGAGNMYYSAQISAAHRDQFLGVVSLYRTKKQGDFTDKEMYMLDQLKHHLSLRLYNEKFQKIPQGRSSPLDAVSRENRLTNREHEILQLLLEGCSTEDMLKKLSISPHTLKKHKSNLYKKLNVANRWELLQRY